jgi:PAS domain S-box-containing protein
VKGTAARVFESGKSEVIYLRIRHKDGTWRHVETHEGAIRSADGKPEGLLAISRMIDDRIVAEAALQAANAETAAFLHAIPSILIGLDSQARITRWNLTASKVFGVSEAAALGRTMSECGIQWQNLDMAAEIQRWLEASDTIRYDNVAYEKDGETRFVAFNVNPVRVEQIGIGGFIIPGADITERNRLEKQRQSLEEQLRQSQKLEAVGQLAAGIAHEINTPTQYVGDNARFLKDSWAQIAGLLTQCRTVLDEAKSGAIQPQTIEAFEQASHSADLDYLLAEIPSAIDQELEGLDRVTKIVRAMKEFSHPGQEKRNVNINKAIATTITVAQNEWKYVADVITHFDETLPGIPCLVGEFNQVMLNLIINAAQAIALTIEQPSNRKGTITISTSRQQEHVQIAIQDTGAGIPEAIQSRIFELFFTTKPVGKGTGQGLALAYSLIVKRHQGRIWFDSKEGEGTTFYVQLPLEGDLI